MSPLRSPERGPAGRRSLSIVFVATLLASVGPAGAAAVVGGADGVVDSDRPGEATAGGPATIGLGVAPVTGLFGQFDPEDEDEEGDDDDHDERADGDDDDEGERSDDDDEAGGDEVADDDGREGNRGENGDGAGPPFGDGAGPPFGEGPTDESGIGDFLETVLTEIAGGPDDDRPGDGGERPPDDRPGRNDEAPGPEEADGGNVDDGDDADGASSSQVEEPTPTESPDPARIRVEDVSTNSSVVAEGEPVRIDAIVVNTGGTEGERRVRLRLFGEVVDARTVTVPADGDRQVSFVRRIEAPGTYEATVGNVSTTVTVEASETPTTTDVAPASQELPGFTATAALLGVLVAALFVRLRR